MALWQLADVCPSPDTYRTEESVIQISHIMKQVQGSFTKYSA